ncbi:hypothetical protein Aab01nite_19070 [Paractinoplanes abujensis]|uniref:Uncharacterized protein n=1 Tax=Paractinoplanes abujensis TaxID=882441 RepID=A0A7W7G699_9ACTN|nr:hypothetical protein [Actinoplanes abujensis]MBB4697210.1 hypothetical protein [Actinoplanes abujensis]GID18317.1 hypothetical protein Aab01nite_19070 [Actinoplanes abujensis]
MERRASPRGLVGRSLLATLVFAAAVVPGWTLGTTAERYTGSELLDWCVTGLWGALTVRVLAPHASYRPRDAWLGLIPLYNWYLVCVLGWRVALLPFRDWEPRDDELWRARWLTGDLVGYWRVDPVPLGAARSARAASAPAGGRRSR